MKMQRFHPLAAITAFCLAGAVAANSLWPDHGDRPATYFFAAVLLASPFAVLLMAHLTIARTWRRNAFLAVGSILFVGGWALATFAMAWFHGGWAGAVFFGVAMALLAALYALLALVIPEGPKAPAV